MRCMSVAAIVLASASVSSAGLVSTDWNTPGDGLLTRDTVNGLDWLDWTQGLAHSYVSMQPELAPGGQFAGFRYATAAELDAFMVSGGVPDVGGRTTANIPTVNNILSLLGANDFFSFLGAGNSSAAFLHDPSNAPPGGNAPFSVFTIETFDNPVTAKAGGLGIGTNNIAFGMGHALVREAPAPGSLGLLALGGLIAARRRRS